jgi:hypothetical protein
LARSFLTFAALLFARGAFLFALPLGLAMIHTPGLGNWETLERVVVESYPAAQPSALLFATSSNLYRHRAM